MLVDDHVIRRRRRLPALVLACALTAAACTSDEGGDGAVTPTTDPPASATSSTTSTLPEDSGTPVDLSPLTNAGIGIVADETATATAPLTLTEIQAARLVGQHGVASGWSGRAIDAVASVPQGSVPMSYLLAAWIASAQSAGANTSRQWMGDQDWSRAPDLRYPPAVVAMFVADLTAAIDAGLPAPGGGPRSPHEGASRRPAERPEAQGGPCSTVANFLATTIDALFGALRLTPTASGGLFADVVALVAQVWNVAVGFAKGVVQGLVDAITAPIFEAIRFGVAALGVATEVVSFFQNHRLELRVEPARPAGYPFAVGSGPDVTADFVASAPRLSDSWPKALVDCARTANATLPELIAPGGEALWEQQSGNDVATLAGTTSRVLSDRTARMRFTTGREESADGELDFKAAAVLVHIPRKELADFLQLARDQVNGAKDLLLTRIPQAELRAAAAAAYSRAIDPVVDQLQQAAADAGGTLFSLEGDYAIVVTFHHRKDPTTTDAPPPPPPSPPGSTLPDDDGGTSDDFCRKLAEYDPASDSADLVTLGQAGIRRMNELAPLAPPELRDDVAVALVGYTAAASGDWNAVAQTAAATAAALLAMFDYCGFAPPEG